MTIRGSLRTLAAVLAAGAIFMCVSILSDGYQMYSQALAEVPLEEKVADIRSKDGYTSFGELPETYVDAVLSVEDHRFYGHVGIDPIAITRALVNDIKAGSFVEGGSTITQQLAKNQYFTQEKKIRRKIGEIFMALEIERECSKREIFEWYVNTIYFGSGYYGIRDAARGYFGKEPEELSDGEAVLLAGLPNAPSVYGSNICSSLTGQRTRQVADQMAACGMLSRQEAEKLCADIGDFVTEKREKTEYDGTR